MWYAFSFWYVHLQWWVLLKNWFSPVVNRTIALRQEYSAESTWRALSFSTCSWKILMWSMKATTLSAAMGAAWSPAAANKGATCKKHSAVLDKIVHLWLNLILALFKWFYYFMNFFLTCKGMEHWLAFKTNNSDQTRRNRATWSVTWNK